jgi:hypothetical protein
MELFSASRVLPAQRSANRAPVRLLKSSFQAQVDVVDRVPRRQKANISLPVSPYYPPVVEN